MDKLTFDKNQIEKPYKDPRLNKMEDDDIRMFFVLADNVTAMMNSLKKFNYLESVKFDLPVNTDNLDLNTLVNHICNNCPQLTRDGITYNIKLNCDNINTILVPVSVQKYIGYSIIDDNSYDQDKLNQDKRWISNKNNTPINWYPIPINLKHSLYHIFVDLRETTKGILFTMAKYNNDLKDIEDECDCSICTGELLVKMMNSNNDSDSEFSDSESEQ